MGTMESGSTIVSDFAQALCCCFSGDGFKWEFEDPALSAEIERLWSYA